MIHIKDKHDCCGCTACASVCRRKAIEMKPDEEGFLYPICDTLLCTNCHLCEQVCPVKVRDSRLSEVYPIKVFALRHRDEDVLRSSSSGGAFAAIVKDSLSQGGIIYGAEYDDSQMVVHRGETSEEGALKFRGSKYVQSNINDVYKEIKTHLRMGKHVLFSGTPCQVEGLNCFLGTSYDNLLTVDILCHGVPSPKVYSDYIKFIRKYSIGHLRDIFMKDKTFGWGYQNLRLIFNNGSTQFNTILSNLWNKIFYSHLVIRPSCYTCRFTNYYRAGDLTIGDFWGIEKSHPNIKNKNGVSVLLINTSKGEKIWARIKSHYIYEESNMEECLQQCLVHPIEEPQNRNAFWKNYRDYGFSMIAKYYYGISYRRLGVNVLNQLISIIRHKINL